MIYDLNNFIVSMPKNKEDLLTSLDVELFNELNVMSLINDSGVKLVAETKEYIHKYPNDIMAPVSYYMVSAVAFKQVFIDIFKVYHSSISCKYKNAQPYSALIKYYLIDTTITGNDTWEKWNDCSFGVINNIIYYGEFYNTTFITPVNPDHKHHHGEKHVEEKHDKEAQLKKELKYLLDRSEAILSAFTKSSNIVTSLIDYVQVYKTALEDIGFQINAASTINAIRPENNYSDRTIGYRGTDNNYTNRTTLYNRGDTAYSSQLKENMCGWVLPWNSDNNQVLYNSSKMVSLQMNRTVTVPSKEFDEIVKIYNDAMSVKDDVTKTLEDIKENFADIIKEINDTHHGHHRPKPPRPEPSTIDEISVTDPHGIHTYLIYMYRTHEMGSEGWGGFEFYDVCEGHTPDEAMMEFQKRMYNKYGEGYELTDLHAVSDDRLEWRDYFSFCMVPLPMQSYGIFPKLKMGFADSDWKPRKDDKLIY